MRNFQRIHQNRNLEPGHDVRDSADVIDMRVSDQDCPHIPELVTDLLDRAFDVGTVGRVSAVDQRQIGPLFDQYPIGVTAPNQMCVLDLRDRQCRSSHAW